MLLMRVDEVDKGFMRLIKVDEVDIHPPGESKIASFPSG